VKNKDGGKDRIKKLRHEVMGRWLCNLNKELLAVWKDTHYVFYSRLLAAGKDRHFLGNKKK
jgi:hypothetical protein